MTRYTREDYEHRHCLAVTRTESGEFVKCLTHTGDAHDMYEVLGPAKPLYNQVETDHERCSQCGDILVTSLRCPCGNENTTVRQFETGAADIHPDDIEQGVLS